MLRVSMLMLMVAGCTSPLLEPGAYDVEVTYTRDDWAASKAGTTSEAEWLIVQLAEDRYQLTVAGSSTIVEGSADDGHIVFIDRQTDDACDRETIFRVDLEPNDNGASFHATGYIELGLCNGSSLVTEATVRSK